MLFSSTRQRPNPMLPAAAAAHTTRSVKIINPRVRALQRRGHVFVRFYNAFQRARHAMRCHAAAAMVDHSSEVRSLLESTNQQWLEHALGNKLTDMETGVTVVLLGVCFFAPMQQQLVQSAMLQLTPEYIAIEQPLETSSNILLPHPVWIQTILDNNDIIADAINNFEKPTEATVAPAAAAAAAGSLQHLEQQLHHAGHPKAAVGRTIIDPWETFGFYAGMDLYKRPAAVASVLQLCGFLPGHELLVAAQHAMQTGATLSCIDAPIKLQEGWVKQLLQNFALNEQQVNAYQPAKDLEANQQLLPAAAAAWDRQLATLAQRLQQAVQGIQTEQTGSTFGTVSSANTLDQQDLSLFQVSKATAAAMLSPAAAYEASKRLQRLQPLKWAHFALRQRYMARQIKELCVTAATAAGRQAAVAVRQQQQDHSEQATTATASTDSSSNRKQASGVCLAGTAAMPVTVLVVVGRQHVHGLETMWRNPDSSLWPDRMPKSFAPSTVEKPEDAAPSKPSAADAKASDRNRAADK